MPEHTTYVPAKPLEQDLKERAFRTFVQTLLPSVIAALAVDVESLSQVVELGSAALIAATAASLSAVQTVLRERWGTTP